MIIHYLFLTLKGKFGGKGLLKALCSKSVELLTLYSYNLEHLAGFICLAWHLNLFLAFIPFDRKEFSAVCIKGSV